jgi:hypothetical protein
MQNKLEEMASQASIAMFAHPGEEVHLISLPVSYSHAAYMLGYDPDEPNATHGVEAAQDTDWRVRAAREIERYRETLQYSGATWSALESSPDPKLAAVRAAIWGWARAHNLADKSILDHCNPNSIVVEDKSYSQRRASMGPRSLLGRDVAAISD